MNIRPIKTKKDYEAALKRIDKLFNAKPNTPSGDELEILLKYMKIKNLISLLLIRLKLLNSGWNSSG